MSAAATAGTRGQGRQPHPVPGLRADWARMTWVTWRQHRAALAGLAVLYAALAAVMLAGGLQVHHLYATAAGDDCLRPVFPPSHVGICRHLLSQFSYTALGSRPGYVAVALLALAVLTGMFLGAPLIAREFDAGTVRFAWTQGTGRTRWAAAKLTLLAILVTAAGCALGALDGWSLQPVRAQGNAVHWSAVFEAQRWTAVQFNTTVVTAAGWILVAFALGVLAGAVIRRTVPAIAASASSAAILLGLVLSLASPAMLAWHPLVTPDTALGALGTVPIPAGGPVPLDNANSVMPAGNWLLYGWYTGPGGHRLSDRAVSALLGRHLGDLRWFVQHHYTFWAAYQPAYRYWLFQGAEGAGLLLLALLLGAVTIWLIRRRSV